MTNGAEEDLAAATTDEKVKAEPEPASTEMDTTGTTQTVAGSGDGIDR
jgi:hypothetical protein